MAKAELTDEQKKQLAKMDAAGEQFKSDLQKLAAQYPEAVQAIGTLVSSYQLTAGYKRMCQKFMEYA
ncbi:MAG: hypothetical protein WC554_10295 [Clostridia bacterium]|jgi:hypothetical protein